MEKNVIEFMEDVTRDFKSRDKAVREKYMPVYQMAFEEPTHDESRSLLKKYGVEITKNSQVMLLCQDSKTVEQALELADKMGFIEAYKADPGRLCNLVTNVIKRMAKCDAVGITYKNDKGQFADFIFSERKFQMQINNLGPEEKKIVEVPTEVASEENNENLAKAKDYAMRLLEQFSITEQAEPIMARLEENKNSGLSMKDMLMDAFLICAGNTELLSDTIDEMIAQEEELKLGRAA